MLEDFFSYHEDRYGISYDNLYLIYSGLINERIKEGVEIGGDIKAKIDKFNSMNLVSINVLKQYYDEVNPLDIEKAISRFEITQFQNKNLLIENQNIRYDVKVMLALIYMNYICPEEEKPNLKKDFQKKKEIQNEILNKKYEINFEKSNDNLDNLNIDTNSFSNDKLAEIHKKGIFKQIIEKIKNLFRKK